MKSAGGRLHEPRRGLEVARLAALTHRFILNADDLGLRPGVNRSVRALLEAGALSSATILTDRDAHAFADAAAMARAMQVPGGPGFGLHLDLEDFFGFDASGHFGATETDAVGNYRGRLAVRRRAAAHAMARQLDTLLDAGVRITHVDGHHNCHLFPEVLETLGPLMAERGVRALRFLPGFYCWRSTLQAARDVLRDCGLAAPGAFRDLGAQPRPAAFLRSPGPLVLEAMCHTEDPAGGEHWRAAQHEFLMSNAALIRTVEPVSFDILFQGDNA